MHVDVLSSALCAHADARATATSAAVHGADADDDQLAHGQQGREGYAVWSFARLLEPSLQAGQVRTGLYGVPGLRGSLSILFAFLLRVLGTCTCVLSSAYRTIPYILRDAGSRWVDVLARSSCLAR